MTTTVGATMAHKTINRLVQCLSIPIRTRQALTTVPRTCVKGTGGVYPVHSTIPSYAGPAPFVHLHQEVTRRSSACRSGFSGRAVPSVRPTVPPLDAWSTIGSTGQHTRAVCLSSLRRTRQPCLVKWSAHPHGPITIGTPLLHRPNWEVLSSGGFLGVQDGQEGTWRCQLPVVIVKLQHRCTASVLHPWRKGTGKLGLECGSSLVRDRQEKAVCSTS